MPLPEQVLKTTSIVGRIYRNLGLLLGGKAAAGLISLAYMVIAARTLGPGDYGVLILLHGYAIAVGGIVNFPGWHAVVRYGAQAMAAGDTPRMLRTLRFAAIVEASGGVLAVLVAMALAPLVGPRLGWSPTAQAFAIPYSLAVLASVRSTPAGLLQLVRRFDLLGAHNAVAPTVRLVGTVLAAVLGWTLKAFLITWLAAALAEWVSLWIVGIIIARRHFGVHPFLAPLRGVHRENPGLWRFMMSANADVTFGELAGRLAPLTVGWALGPAAAGLYAVAQRATVIFAQPAQILGQAAYAELARMVAADSGGRAVRHALFRCIGIAFASALPVLLILILFSQQTVMLLAGTGFSGAVGLLKWLALARMILLIAPPISAALTALGQPLSSVAANLAGGLGLWPLLPLLIWKAGLDGAGLHAVIQACVTTLLLGYLVWRASARTRAWAA